MAQRSGGLALLVDRPWAYLAVFAFDATTSVVAGFLNTYLDHIRPTGPRAAGAPRLAVLRDTPYVVVTLLGGLVAMHFTVMEVGIPLFIAKDTDARWRWWPCSSSSTPLSWRCSRSG